MDFMLLSYLHSYIIELVKKHPNQKLLNRQSQRFKSTIDAYRSLMKKMIEKFP
jgi:hypothetical protein